MAHRIEASLLTHGHLDNRRKGPLNDALNDALTTAPDDIIPLLHQLRADITDLMQTLKSA